MEWFLVLALLATPAQDPLRPVDSETAFRAADRGVLYLKTAEGPTPELRLLALAHHGIPENDAAFAALLRKVLEAPLERTDRVAFQARALEQIDRAKYQVRLAEAAQFLVDNQAKDGLWSRGEPTEFALVVPPLPPAPPLPPGAKPAVLREIRIGRRREEPERGDFSHAQLAVLGLLACHEAKVRVPAETLERAAKAWVERQGADGSWDSGVALTASGTGSLLAIRFMQGRKFKDDPDARRGIAWLERHHDAASDPDPALALWSLDRAALYWGEERLGAWDWYPDLVRALVGSQRPDGSWLLGESGSARDTSLALLVLRPRPRPWLRPDPPRRR